MRQLIGSGLEPGCKMNAYSVGEILGLRFGGKPACMKSNASLAPREYEDTKIHQ